MYFPEKFYKKHYVVWRIRVNDVTISQFKIEDVKNTTFVRARTRCNTREKNDDNFLQPLSDDQRGSDKKI